jgi:hypothetical protein
MAVAIGRRLPLSQHGASEPDETVGRIPGPAPGRGHVASTTGGVSWQPPKPILYANDSREADEARALLERYGIDFEVRETRDPLISLRWKHLTYTDIFGITDFVMFAGRLLPELRKSSRGDQAVPGTRVPLRAP